MRKPGININVNINRIVRIFRAPKQPPVIDPVKHVKFSLKDAGTLAASLALVVSESMPFFEDVKANGFIHGLFGAVTVTATATARAQDREEKTRISDPLSL